MLHSIFYGFFVNHDILISYPLGTDGHESITHISCRTLCTIHLSRQYFFKKHGNPVMGIGMGWLSPVNSIILDPNISVVILMLHCAKTPVFYSGNRPHLSKITYASIWKRNLSGFMRQIYSPCQMENV